MEIWRAKLNPNPDPPTTLQDVFQFCFNKGIIGVGWTAIDCTSTTYNDDCLALPDKRRGKSAKKAMKALNDIKIGDLIWTRVGNTSSDYYLSCLSRRLPPL